MFFHHQLKVGVIFEELNHVDDMVVVDLLQEEDFVGQTLAITRFHPTVSIHFRLFYEFGDHQLVASCINGQLNAPEASAANLLDKLI